MARKAFTTGYTIAAGRVAEEGRAWRRLVGERRMVGGGADPLISRTREQSKPVSAWFGIVWLSSVDFARRKAICCGLAQGAIPTIESPNAAFASNL